MKLTRSTYPQIPSVRPSPCWQFQARRLWADLDVNTRFPFGFSLAAADSPPGVGDGPRRRRWGITLDVNAPLGEPNRLYLSGRRRDWMIGLVEWHRFKETGQHTTTLRSGRTIPCVEGHDVRCRPRLVRGQAWDWDRSEGSTPPVWRWVVVHPADWRERWAAAHPQEAAAVEERAAARRRSSAVRAPDS